MLDRRIVHAACLAALLVTLQGFDYPPDYSDTYNQIDEEERTMAPSTDPPSSPCSAPDLSKWDKLFTMLENSQMKENMLLQYSDEVVKVGLQSLRGEILELVARSGGSCTVVAETAARQATAQVTGELLSALNQLKMQVSEVCQKQAVRLQMAEGGLVKSLTTRHLEERDAEDRGRTARSLQALSDDLRSLRENVVFYTQAMASKMVPAGCDTALLFPARSSRTHAEVIPLRSLRTRAFTVCLWAKPAQTPDRSVLFSYGTKANPLELQLLLSGDSALFTVGGETGLVVAPGAVEAGRWTHLCGTWSSEQGLAALWADGLRLASSPGVAEGHEVPGGGAAVLGHGGEGLDGDGTFAGKMSGVDAWDRVLTENEIQEQARVDGGSCGARGNLVAWGVSQFLERGGVRLLY